MTPTRPDIAVFGLGNRFRGDDALGPIAAQLIREFVPNTIPVYTDISDASSLLDLWDGLRLAVVIDCAVSGAQPGKIYRIDAIADGLPERFTSTFSTHALSIGQALELGRTLGRLPDRLIVFAVEGARFDCGAPMSDEVIASAVLVAKDVAGEISGLSPEVLCE